jgi:uncharacterized membrane protein YfcA
VAVGFVGGGINTIVGGGSLLTFPTLLALGLPPVSANVANKVGLSPGSVSSVAGYRRELAGQVRAALWLGALSLLGSVVGGLLLLRLPPSVFRTAVPFVILLAAVLTGVQPWVARRVADVSPHRLGVLGYAGVGLTGAYSGYFGAGQGVVLLALLGIVSSEGLQRRIALKNVLAAVNNVAVAVLFIAISHVAWLVAGLIAAASVVGAQVGALVGRRVPARPLRWIITIGGGIVAAVLFVKQYVGF